jgi:hypothetical protein
MVLVARAQQEQQAQLACLARQVRKVLLAPKGWQAQQAFLVQ